jgi:beta-lactamase regulating signal transducer with metallopeptidase domain
MSYLDSLLPGRLFQTGFAVQVTLILVHFLWQGALLGLTAMAADRWVRSWSSRVRYAVFVGILLTMGVAPPATYWVIGGQAGDNSMSTPAPPTGPFVMTNNAPTTIPRLDGAPLPTSAPGSGGDFTPTAGPEPEMTFTSPPSFANEPRTRGIEAYASFVFVAYLVGAVLMFARLVIALQGGRRMRLSATVIQDGPVAEMVRRQAQRIGLKTAPIVAWCGRISVPVVVGIVRPMILLPAALATGFDPNQLEALVTHELAHIRRYDPIVNIVQRLIEVALFFHPAIWYVSRRVSAERENACDDLVVSAGWPALRYAEALLQMAELCAATRGIRTGQGPLLAASGSGSSQFKRRVLRLLEVHDAPRVRLSRGGAVLLATAAALTFMTPTLIRAVAGSHQELEVSQKNENATVEKVRTLERVFAAWKARQERVKSFHFSWTARVTLPKGYAPPSSDDPLLAGLRTGENGPGRDVEMTIPQSEWWGDGESRFRSDIPVVGPSGANGGRQRSRIRVIQDGNLFSRLEVPVNPRETALMSLYRKLDIKNPEPAAGTSGDLLLKWREVDLAPLRLALRPLTQVPFDSAPFCYNTLAWSPENCQVVSENAIVGNVHCIKLEQDRNNHFETCWADPKRDYIVVLWERRILDRPARSVAIEYRQDREHGWLPSHWTCQVAGSPAQRSPTLEATVTHYTINEPFHDNPFANTSPSSTKVYDVTVDRPISVDSNQSGTQQPREARKTLDAIAAAWRKRQAGFKSFKFNWRSELAEGGTSVHTLCVDGKRFSWAYSVHGGAQTPMRTNAKASDPRRGRQIHHATEARLAFDGATTTHLLNTFDDDSRPFVTIESGFRENYVQHRGDRCLFYALCPSDAQYGRFELSKFKVAKRGGTIDGVQCVIIETEVDRGRQEDYWLDPARDYILVREHHTLNGEDFMRIDFSYRFEPNYGWIPTGWKDAFAGEGGAMIWSSTDTITDFSINRAMPDSEFKVEIPKGAQVNDLRKGNR